MEKTVRSRFVAIHPFQIAREVSNWLGIARKEPGRYERPIACAQHRRRLIPKKVRGLCNAGPYQEAARRLQEVAQSEQGFFTTKQAIRSGFAEKTHSYHYFL
jgi:hypothetical protein